MQAANKGSKLCVPLLLICAWFAISGATKAAAASEELVFDPVLSLTGSCDTSEVDPVWDPGCPGGEHPPAGAFNLPRSIVTDIYGDIYVASYGNESAEGSQGRIDIFDASGKFLTEISDPAGPKSLAVDRKGNLYVFQFKPGNNFRKVERYEPSVYNPEAGEIEYGNAPELVVETLGTFCGIAVDRDTDHLFVHLGGHVQEYSSAEDDNKPLETIGDSTFNHSEFPEGLGLAVDSNHGLIYASDKRTTAPNDFLIDVFELEAPHDLIQRIDGSSTPSGKFGAEPSVAVDEGSGNVFVYPTAKTVYEFTEDGTLVDEIEHSFKEVFGGEIGVDNGALSPNAGYLFVPSNPTGVGHSFAFGLREDCVAEVVSATFANVTEEEAELRGAVNPCHLETSYTFEVTPLQRYESEGFTGAQVVKEGQLAAGASAVPVSAALSNLTPGTAYRFRLSATNELGGDGAEGEFKTYPLSEPKQPCANDASRAGFSAVLPDCRAYELVTPPETNARAPRGAGTLGPYFTTREVSPAGDRLSFIIEGGTLPGQEGTGALAGDPYSVKREATGWVTSPAGPSGGESAALLPGGVSPDQGYSFWNTGGAAGSAVVGGKDTAYVRYPDGHSALVGRGSIGTDPQAIGKLISENGSHIVFVSGSTVTTGVPLEPGAPPSGTSAIYDRTSDEVTHVVSLLPDDKTPKSGENAFYEGASFDGKGVAFRIGPGGAPSGSLYLRYNNERTFEIAPAGSTFAGIAEGGARTFYLEGGKLFRFDALTEEVKAFNASGTVIPVNVSADGSTAYFVSTAKLTPSPNPNGQKAVSGEENLYRSREGAISFVGIVTHRDVVGESNGIEQVEGLGLWDEILKIGKLAADPSRTTPDGSALLFESRAALDGYDPEGHVEVYRYDFAANELDCLSCNPTLAHAGSDASLQSIGAGLGEAEPLSLYGYITNLRADGRRAFFQSTEQLVPSDTDGFQDVYEWEAPGIGSCTRAGGCLYLISSGQSRHANYLYAVSSSGDDVFFQSTDLLVPDDLEETASIYDARVGGGFPQEAVAVCQGEGCRTALPPPPSMIAPESAVHGGEAKKTCPKGKRKVRRHGKVRCVKKHPKHRKHHRKAGTKKQGGHK